MYISVCVRVWATILYRKKEDMISYLMSLLSKAISLDCPMPPRAPGRLASQAVSQSAECAGHSGWAAPEFWDLRTREDGRSRCHGDLASHMDRDMVYACVCVCVGVRGCVCLFFLGGLFTYRNM